MDCRIQVVTHPTTISRNPISLETSLTAKPASLKAFAVPPEAIRFKPKEVRFLANSTRPVLSETLNKAETQDMFPYHSHSTVRCLSFKTLGKGTRGRFREGSHESQGHHHLCQHYPSPNPQQDLTAVIHLTAGLGLQACSAARATEFPLRGRHRWGRGGGRRGARRGWCSFARIREGLTELAGCHGC